MASFRLYNIQLLPLNTSQTPEVGLSGYQRLFDSLRAAFETAHRTKSLVESSHKLPHDTYFSPFTIVADTKYARGKWVKYQRAESVVDLYTNKSLFTAAEGDTAVSNTHLFRFVFDYETHRLAIEELGGKLPSPNSLMNALVNILKPIADQEFPEHTLTINLVSETKALEQALSEAKGFRHVEVRITFPNGHELSQRLREMRDNNVHVVKAEASSDKDALMPKLPDFILELVRASTDYGRSKFTYFKDKRAGRQVYSSEDYPEKLRLRQKKNEQEASFIDRILARLKGTVQAPADKPAEQE